MLSQEEIILYTNEFNNLFIYDIFSNKSIVGNSEEEDNDFIKQMKEIKINDLFINKDKEINTIINNIKVNHPYINSKEDFINVYNKIISNYKIIYYGREVELYKLYNEFLKISKNIKLNLLESVVNKQTYIINKYDNRFQKISLIINDYENRIKQLELFTIVYTKKVDDFLHIMKCIFISLFMLIIFRDIIYYLH
jgi:hypothetical protein